MDERQEVAGRFFVARRDSTIMLDAVDKAFNLVAAAVLFPQQSPGNGASRPGGNDGRAAAGLDFRDELVTVVPLVGDQVVRLVVGQQPGSLGHVVGLSRREDQFDRPPRRFHGDVQLGAEPAARSPEGLVLAPFFLAPAACWWARMTVESSISDSRSGSCQTCRSRAQTPRSDQRLKRWKTEFHFPNRSGRSRQGVPVLAIHRTALMKPRLSAAVRPGSPGFPGRRSLIFSHCSSEISCRRTAVFLHERPPRSIPGPHHGGRIGWGRGISEINVNRT